MSEKPLILVANDDGVEAEGNRILREALDSLGEVWTVAPRREQSTNSHSLTLHKPLRLEKMAKRVYAVDGTPADCTYVALFHDDLLPRTPDLVVSGINHGPNLGTDVMYSGTVAAAMEATIEGLPALAVSCADFRWRHFKPSASLALDVAEGMLRQGWPERLLLNLNVPPLPQEAIGPLRWCRTAVRRYIDQFDRRTDPRGRTYYWLAGEVANDLEAAVAGPGEWPTDVAWIAEGGVSLSPLQPELFWRGDSQSLPEVQALR